MHRIENKNQLKTQKTTGEHSPGMLRLNKRDAANDAIVAVSAWQRLMPLWQHSKDN
jgi:hypothetical protein